jgi:hypothetical protein
VVASNITILKLHVFMKFCYLVHHDVFGNISILKSPIITVGQLIGIFSNIVSKIEVK